VSKALPVVQERTDALPRAVIDFDEKLAAHGLELRAAPLKRRKSTAASSATRRASTATWEPLLRARK